MKQVKYSIFCLCLLSGFRLFPQSNNPYNNFTIRTLTPDDGLSQGSNYFRYEDSQGFMWLTANDALNRYDGKMVKVYNLDKYFKDCPPLQQGYGFAEDNESNIYVGSTRGLYIYHRNTDKFTLKKIFTSPDEVAMPIAFKGGKIWCFNRVWQLSTYDVKTCKVEMITQMELKPIASLNIYASSRVFYARYPFIDNENTIWMISVDNIAAYSISKKNIAYPLQLQKVIGKFNFMSCLYDTMSNKILFSSEERVLEYEIKKTQFKSFKRSFNDFHVAVYDAIRIRAADNVIKMIDEILAGKVFKEFTENEFRDKINRFFVSQMFDKSGNLWINVNGQGLLILNFHPSLMHTKPDNSLGDRYRMKYGVQSFGELPNGDILIHPVILLHNEKIVDTLPSKFKELISYRKSIDSFRNGLWYYWEYKYKDIENLIFFSDKKNKISLVIDRTNEDIKHLADLVVLPDGRILCSLSKGLSWLIPEKKSFHQINSLKLEEPFKINLLSNKRVAVSYIGNDMRLIQILPGDDIKIIKTILPGIQSYYIQEDLKRNQYWVGTNQGIYVLDKSLNPIKKFDANNGMAGTNIYGLLLDDSGNVWCSHQHGLSSIDAESYHIINYDKEDGIQDWDFNNRSFYKAKDGTLYFGGVSGFNYFKPPLKLSTYTKPEVYIDEILVNHKLYLPDTNANLIQLLNLNYTQNNISVKAMVKDLANGTLRQLIYRLESVDTTWKFLPDKSPILFNNLAPGSYTLEMGVYDKFNSVMHCQKTIAIYISTPFYKRIWFIVIMTILFTAIFLWQYNRRKLLKHKRVFEQQLALEAQRNKITADLHDDIGATLSSLQVNSNIANQLLEKNKEQAKLVLKKIEEQSQNLSDKIGDFIWSMKPGKDEFMSLSNRIKTFASDILGSTDIHYIINIDKEIDSLNIDISMRKNIVLITKEAINNAAKYSKALNIIIEIVHEKEDIILSVADDGIGMNANENNFTGNGLNNMQKRAEELNGEFKIISSPNQGTKILVKFKIIDIY